MFTGFCEDAEDCDLPFAARMNKNRSLNRMMANKKEKGRIENYDLRERERERETRPQERSESEKERERSE